MPEYHAPLRDMRFVLFELLDSAGHYGRLNLEAEVTPDLVDAILEEAGRFAGEVLSPLNAVGDEEGCHWSPQGVTTPTGFKQAYQQFVDAGWPAMTAAVGEGGQGLPESVGVAVREMMGSANWAWAMYPGLSHGAVKTVSHHGSEEQKRKYLGHLVDGSWTGTMCLTEPHCGTDLGLLRTRAEPQADGSYKVTGTKIFISAGEHDMAENIVHIVLARLPDAPAGTKGISLFIVPKFLVEEDGGLGARNQVQCGSLEKKMGIKGSATCVMNFDGATGYLIGPANRGLNCMFTFMNTARLGTALQGLCHAESAFQGAIKYARERLQMRSISGPKNPNGPADPIIVHPDVRRMLLTQKAFAEGLRGFLFWLAQYVDVAEHCPDESARKDAEDMLALLTPIAKAFGTDAGFEAANHGVQVYGGHGYIREWGMEQIVRDARISMLYEGTNGVQAMDLIGRKVLGSGGQLLLKFTGMIEQFCAAHSEDNMREFVEPLQAHAKEWVELTGKIGERALQNADEAGAASVDYLQYSGYVTLAYMWARMASIALAKHAEGEFYQAKLNTARFYFARLLPRARSHAALMLAGADNLMTMADQQFTLHI